MISVVLVSVLSILGSAFADPVVNPCGLNTCPSGQTCKLFQAPNLYGCVPNTSPCYAFNDCNGNGKCDLVPVANNKNTYFCNCNFPYYGVSCEKTGIDISCPAAKIAACSKAGHFLICNMEDSTGTGVKSPKCYCQAGWTGENCDLQIPNFP